MTVAPKQSAVFFSCSANDGSNRAANTQQVDTRGLKQETGSTETLLQVVSDPRQMEIKFGLYLRHKQIKFKGRIGNRTL